MGGASQPLNFNTDDSIPWSSTLSLFFFLSLSLSLSLSFLVYVENQKIEESALVSGVKWSSMPNNRDWEGHGGIKGMALTCSWDRVPHRAPPVVNTKGRHSSPAAVCRGLAQCEVWGSLFVKDDVCYLSGYAARKVTQTGGVKQKVAQGQAWLLRINSSVIKIHCWTKTFNYLFHKSLANWLMFWSKEVSAKVAAKDQSHLLNARQSRWRYYGVRVM